MKKILVAVDLQKDFVDGALGTAEAVEMLPRAVEYIKGFDGELYFTLDTHTEDYLNTSEGRKLPVVHCVKGTDGWQLAAPVKALADTLPCTVVEKPSFGSTELPALIKERCNGEELDITLLGLCTDICVISNAMILKAWFPEARIAIESACCAGVTPESHENALKAMPMCQMDIR